jgi:hypothetical protein
MRIAAMSSPRNIARHVIVLIVILVALSALAIWLGLGPVVHSQGALAGSAISN